MTKTVRGPLAFLVGTLVMAKTSTALLRSDAEAEVSRALVSFGSGIPTAHIIIVVALPHWPMDGAILVLALYHSRATSIGLKECLE